MSIDGKTQFIFNVVYIAHHYDVSSDDMATFLGITPQERKGLFCEEYKWAAYDLARTDKHKYTGLFMPTYDEAGKLATLAGVELFEVFSRSLKRLDELGELPQ